VDWRAPVRGRRHPGLCRPAGRSRADGRRPRLRARPPRAGPDARPPWSPGPRRVTDHEAGRRARRRGGRVSTERAWVGALRSLVAGLEAGLVLGVADVTVVLARVGLDLPGRGDRARLFLGLSALVALFVGLASVL